jgi:glycosyltransferase involved in cell wall biosynthesis
LSGGTPAAVLDARMALHSGIGRYIRGLVPALRSLDPALSLLLLGPPDREDAPWRAGTDTVAFRAPIYSLREQLEGSRLCRRLRQRAGVFHFPHYNAPWWLPASSVVTVHDLTHLELSGLFPRGRAAAARLLMRRVVRRARRLIAVSGATRDALERCFPGAGEKTTVVHHGLEPCFRPLEAAVSRSFREEHGLRRFFLYVGNAKPHKNLPRLLAAVQEVRRFAVDAELVMVTGDAVSIPPGREGIRVLGPVSDPTLARWYGTAQALVLPSLNEGFGLPAAEAMACGTPVIGSAIPALTEVVGEAGLLADPRDTGQLVANMLRLLEDDDRRRELARRSVERARSFSWAESARRHLEVYRDAAGVGA